MALYQQYRSQQLEELSGQSHIVRILSNAIQGNRVGHAYLFSGPRGTGKTSTARILAKSMNCKEGMTVSPCGTCHNCLAIASGQSVDVIEMDAASNTGVDHIRSIIEQVVFQSVDCRFRMYIIDEVHMLSTGAFNALLKTLEEPPSHVVFILATTEPHKVPATIHSRCQHLQFRPLSHDELVSQLSKIATAEGLSVEPDVFDLIARRGLGSMRDAISLLEQAIAYGGRVLSTSEVRSILGMSEPNVMAHFIHSVCQGDCREVLKQVSQWESGGVHPTQLIEDMISYLTHKVTDAVQETGGGLHHWISLLDGLSRLMVEFRHFPDPYTLIRVRLLGHMATLIQPPPTRIQVEEPRIVKNDSEPKVGGESQGGANEVASLQAIKAGLGGSVGGESQGGIGSNTDDIDELWQRVINKIQQESKPIYSILMGSRVDRVGNSLQIHLRQSFSFFIEKLKEPGNQQLLNDVVQSIFPFGMTVLIAGGDVSSAALSNETPERTVSQARTSHLNDIVSLFDGVVLGR